MILADEERLLEVRIQVVRVGAEGDVVARGRGAGALPCGGYRGQY